MAISKKGGSRAEEINYKNYEDFFPFCYIFMLQHFFRKDLKKNIKYQAAEISRRKDRREKTESDVNGSRDGDRCIP